MGNLDKNLDKRIENLKPVPFTKDNQPSPEAKKKGWERRREAQKIMDEMLNLTSMSYKEIKDLLEDIKVHPENHTLREVKIANYLMEKKFTVDYLDRHISKAPQEIDVTSGGDKLSAGIFIRPPEDDGVPTT
jgi:hypothetical protein